MVGARREQDGQVASVDHVRTQPSRPVNQPAEVGMKLGCTASDIDGHRPGPRRRGAEHGGDATFGDPVPWSSTVGPAHRSFPNDVLQRTANFGYIEESVSGCKAKSSHATIVTFAQKPRHLPGWT
jgi:hypothetical protein